MPFCHRLLAYGIYTLETEKYFFIHAYSVRMYEWNNFYFNCCNCSSILYWLKLRWFYVYFD